MLGTMETTSAPSPKRPKMDSVNGNRVCGSPVPVSGIMNGSPRPRHQNDVRTALEQFCASLSLDEDIAKEALAVWDDIFQQQQRTESLDMQGEDAVWFCCFIYIASVHIRTQTSVDNGGSKENASISLTDILRPARVTVSDLFKKMRLLRDTHLLNNTFVQQLLHTERKFIIVCPLYSKFERIFEAVFLPESDQYTVNGSHATLESEYLLKKKLCWTLFVYAKTAVFSSSQQLVVSFYLLLSCIDYVMSTTPSFMLKAPYNESDRLSELCNHYDASLDEVKVVYTEFLEPLLASLQLVDGAIDVAHLTNLYMLVYTREADINELLFLSHDAHLQVKSQKTKQEQLNNNNNGDVSPTVSPFATPVRAAMNTVQQLRNLLNNASQEPGPGLLSYFMKCSTKPVRSIEACVQLLHEDFVSAFTSTSGPTHLQLAEQRFQLAQRLYYRVMEAMLRLEEQRLAQVDFTSLLNNMTFHRCLLACSLEVVLVTYNRGHDRSEDEATSFPWILGIFKIQAYDFFKVLESFIKAEPKLTREAVKHLQLIENKILESLVWKNGSSLFDILVTSEVNQVPQPPASPGRPLEPSSSAAQLYLSPCPPRYGSQPRVAEPGQGLPPRRTSQSLNMFFNKDLPPSSVQLNMRHRAIPPHDFMQQWVKQTPPARPLVCRLGYQRLQFLCDRLRVAKDVQQKIWTCLEYCITQRYDLLKNRQIDQIMMCCMYAISKVVEREIRFKVIVNEYRTLPHVSAQVYRRVHISGDEYDSLIGFYNRVFMNEMKSYVVQFASSRQMPSLSPVPSSPQPSSPYHVPGRKNFFVSPLKQSPFKTPASPGQLTPRSRQLYNFGEGPGSSEKLKNINETMRALANQIPAVRQPSRSQKCLQFDNMTEDASPSSNQPLIPVRRTTPAISRKCLTFTEGSEGSPRPSRLSEDDKS